MCVGVPVDVSGVRGAFVSRHLENSILVVKNGRAFVASKLTAREPYQLSSTALFKGDGDAIMLV